MRGLVGTVDTVWFGFGLVRVRLGGGGLWLLERVRLDEGVGVDEGGAGVRDGRGATA